MVFQNKFKARSTSSLEGKTMDNNCNQRRQAHNSFRFSLSDSCDLKISSDFDSGNLESAYLASVSQTDPIPTAKIDLTPAAEPFNPQFSSRPSNKTFFHFSVQSTHQPVILHAVIKRMGILALIQNNFDDYYQLCVGFRSSAYQQPEYQKARPQCMNLLRVGEDYYLQFKYQLAANVQTFFAYHFPYSVEKLRGFLEEIQEKITKRNQENLNTEVYYKNELLIETLENRPVNLLTLTHGIKLNYSNLSRQQRISKSLFPYYDLEVRPYKFSKPYIMLTCRVHPGQTSASFGLEGFIRKLLDGSHQSEFLLKCFVFLIVPMLNPDGVYHGTYRMDTLGHNLNRFYNGSAPHRQPSIFAVQALIQYHSEDIVGYFDIHSHPAIKGSFFYGNAFSNIHEQIQSQLFAKIFSFNSETFIYEQCSFSEKNMNSKDINDILTKDGSARVCAYKKMPSAIHCYTLEMGYHGSPLKKEPPIPCPFKSNHRRKTRFFDKTDFLEEGAALANTIAQIYYHNIKPVSFQHLQQDQLLKTHNFYNQQYYTEAATPSSNPNGANSNYLQLIREEIGRQIYQKEERFKVMDVGLLKKLKNAHKEINSIFYGKLMKKYSLVEENAKWLSNCHHEKLKIIMNRRGQEGEDLIHLHSLQLNQKLKKNIQQAAANEFEALVGISAVYQRQILKDGQVISAQLRISEDAEKYPRGLRAKNLKSKVNITPVEFILPPENKKVKRGVSGPPKNQTNLNHLINLHLDSLPKIDKKKTKPALNRNSCQKNKRVSSSLKSQKLIQAQQVDLHFNKLTIENQMDEILNIEEKINLELEKQQAGFSQSDPETKKTPTDEDIDQLQKRKSSDEEIQTRKNLLMQNYYNPEGLHFKNFHQMNHVHNDSMYKRGNSKQNSERSNKLSKNYQTERLQRKNIKPQKISSRELSIRKRQNQQKKAAFLPKLQGKTEKIRSRFDLQLQMKEKYDKEYFVEQIND